MSENKSDITYVVDANVEKAQQSFEDLQLTLNNTITLLYGALGILRKLTGNEKVDDAISTLIRLIQVLNMARISILALQASMGPVGWALAIVGGVGTAVTLFDELGSVL